MPRTVSLKFVDIGNESSNMTVWNAPYTAANIGQQLTDFGALKTAVQGITIGELQQETLQLDKTELSNALPTNGFAQRELKLLLRYRGNTNNEDYQLEIPMPDLANLQYTSGPGDFIVLADGGIMAAFVTAFETFAVAPKTDNEAVTVVSAEVVGRNI